MSVIDFYFNANFTLPTLKSKLIWNFFVVSIFEKNLLESFIRTPAIQSQLKEAGILIKLHAGQ